MRNFIFALTIAALASGGVPAIAADAMRTEIRRADDQVAHQQYQTNLAVQSGDAATIAVERAKLQAARAVAWGKRHPAKTPMANAPGN
ncbi:hypothetical protein BH09PSE3_BH09PSE3_19530 [soil metagenome]